MIYPLMIYPPPIITHIRGGLSKEQLDEIHRQSEKDLVFIFFAFMTPLFIAFVVLGYVSLSTAGDKARYEKSFKEVCLVQGMSPMWINHPTISGKHKQLHNNWRLECWPSEYE
jgi:hypothetical protein